MVSGNCDLHSWTAMTSMTMKGGPPSKKASAKQKGTSGLQGSQGEGQIGCVAPINDQPRDKTAIPQSSLPQPAVVPHNCNQMHFVVTRQSSTQQIMPITIAQPPNLLHQPIQSQEPQVVALYPPNWHPSYGVNPQSVGGMNLPFTTIPMLHQGAYCQDNGIRPTDKGANKGSQ